MDKGQEDVKETLSKMMRWQRIKPLDADHLCTVVLQSVKSDNLEWATMEPDVLTNVKLVYKHLLQDTQNKSELFYFPACF